MPRPAAALPPAMKDPLLAAVVSNLPPAGAPWDHAARESWFEMMRKAVDVVYGPLIGGKTAREIQATPVAAAAAAGSVALRYVIEPDGAASVRGAGRDVRPIDPGDIPPDTVLHDYRVQPVDNEYNPIMWKTHGAVSSRTGPVPLPPGVIIRAASEPWLPAGAMNGSAEAST